MARRYITSDGTRYYIDGKPSTAIRAHQVLVEDEQMTNRTDRIELLESIKAHPEETPQ